MNSDYQQLHGNSDVYLCPWFPINAEKRCPLLFQHTLIMLPFQWYWIMMLTKFSPCLIPWQLTQESKHSVICYINKITYNIWTMTYAESCFINLLHRSQQDSPGPKVMLWICCFLPWSGLKSPAGCSTVQNLAEDWAAQPFDLCLSDVKNRIIQKQCMLRNSHSSFLTLTDRFWLMSQHGVSNKIIICPYHKIFLNDVWLFQAHLTLISNI